MMTITEYAEKIGKSAATIYSWISRGQSERNGFRVIKIGKMNLIEEIEVKKKRKAA